MATINQSMWDAWFQGTERKQAETPPINPVALSHLQAALQVDQTDASGNGVVRMCRAILELNGVPADWQAALKEAVMAYGNQQREAGRRILLGLRDGTMTQDDAGKTAADLSRRWT